MSNALVRAEVWLRCLGPALIGLGLCAFCYVLGQMSPSRFSVAAVAVIVAQVYVISEVCRATFVYLSLRWAAERGLAYRLWAHLGIGAAIAVAYSLAVYVPIKWSLIASGERDAIGWLHLSLIGLAALGVALCLSLAQFSLRFFAGWRQSELEAARLQRETLRAQLEALQAKVNPHFLFNSLNALYGAIEEDPALAKVLVLKLAEVFRYVLEIGDKETVPLAQELAFLSAYVQLLRARHGSSLEVTIAFSADETRYVVPPLTLQLLVENAVKHNALDARDPLVVSIEHDGDRLTVRNPRRPRTVAEPGTGTGLANVRRRFALLDPRPVEVCEEPTQFTVSVPLIGAS